MRVLVACEESQAVTIEFRKLGHEAYSCDIEPCSGGHPEWHLKCDALERYKKAMEAKMFFMKFIEADCPRIAVENPTPMKLVGLPPYTQAIQPYEYGHPYSKRTCLWLKGLPPLQPTDILDEHEPYVNGGCKDAHGNYRRFQGRKERDPKIRSKTFPGIARAMAEQWGGI